MNKVSKKHICIYSNYDNLILAGIGSIFSSIVDNKNNLVRFCFSEILRVIKSLQLVDRIPQIATPANWVVSIMKRS